MLFTAFAYLSLPASAATAQQVVNYAISQLGHERTRGMCLAFVNECFEACGCAYSSACCAYMYGKGNIVSTSIDNIPVGAVVLFSGGSTKDDCGNYAGHAGLYVGDGYMIHTCRTNNGPTKVTKSTVKSVANWAGYSYMGWRWHGNDVFTAKPTNVSLNVYGTRYAVGSTVTFNFAATGMTYYNFRITCDGETVKYLSNQTAASQKYTITKAGQYRAWFSACNSAGYTDSNAALFSAGNKITFDKCDACISDNTIKIRANGVNIARYADSLIIYNRAGTNTGTNTYGYEITVDSTGKAVSDSPYGKGNSSIPSGGFVLSGHDAGLTKLTQIKLGYYVSYDPQTLEIKAYKNRNDYLLENYLVVNSSDRLPLPDLSEYMSDFSGWSYTADSFEPDYLAGDIPQNVNSSITLYPVCRSYNDSDVTSIEIVSPAKKTEYALGEDLDLSGLQIEATYSQGYTRTLTEGFTVSGFDSSTAGTKTVTVSYAGFSVSFEVEVSRFSGWSEWIPAEKLPENVVNDTTGTYEIEYTDGYRSRTKETKKSGKSRIEGWTLYDTVSTPVTDSNYVTSKPNTTPAEIGDSLVTKTYKTYYYYYLYGYEQNGDPTWAANDTREALLKQLGMPNYNKAYLRYIYVFSDTYHGEHWAQYSGSTYYTNDYGQSGTINVNNGKVHFYYGGERYIVTTTTTDYYHFRWTDWSDPVPEAPSASSDVEVTTVRNGLARYRVAACEHEFEQTFTYDVQPAADATGLRSRHCTKCSAVTDETEVYYKVGDLDCDKGITLKDIKIMKSFFACAVDSSDFAAANADVNRDGKIDMKDFRFIKRILAGEYYE